MVESLRNIVGNLFLKSFLAHLLKKRIAKVEVLKWVFFYHKVCVFNGFQRHPRTSVPVGAASPSSAALLFFQLEAGPKINAMPSFGSRPHQTQV